jgi:hypothetical protein
MRDMGVATDPDFYAYAVMANEERVVLRACARVAVALKSPPFPPKPKCRANPAHIGVSAAVYNGLAVVSMPLDNKLVFIDTKERKVIGLVSDAVAARRLFRRKRATSSPSATTPSSAFASLTCRSQGWTQEPC